MIRIIQLFRQLKRTKYRLIIREILLGVAVFAVVITVAQLLYPANRVLPSVAVQGYGVGGKPVAEAEKILENRYRSANLVVTAGGKKTETSLAAAGIDINAKASVRIAASYPWYQRIIPFSSLAIMLRRDTSVAARYDEERLRYFAAQVSKESFVPEVNANISIQNGQARLVSARPSQSYPTDQVIDAIRQAALQPRTNLRLTPITKPAERTDNEVRPVLKQAQGVADWPLTLTLAGQDVRVEKATMGNWLDVTEDVGGNLRLTLKTDAVRTYLEQIQGKMYQEPGTSTVQLLDGREVSRTTGAPGRGIAIDQAIALLQTTFNNPDTRTVDLPIAELPPKIVYNRTFSSSDTGLSTLLKDIVRAKGNYAIAVMELNGRSANANGTKQFTSASTFKLFVAYAVFQRIDAGAMHWSDIIVNGRSAESCFEVMIVNSDNACAKAFGDLIGWANIDAMMDGLGLTSTQVVSGNHLTTANDLALFLYKLEKGTLLSAGNRAKLLDAMKRQIYRSGIPAGTGVTVADKVGFLDGLLHDAAIVYGPKGPYVLVILSDGSSWSQLADAGKQVHTFLKQ
jgi:beta-lactamase class A